MLGSRTPWDESSEPILRAPRIVVAFFIAFAGLHLATQFLSEAQYLAMIDAFALIP